MSFYEGKKVFIAGGAGLCGQALIRKLVPLGAKVTATEFRHRKIDGANVISIWNNFDLHERTGPKSTINFYDGYDIVFWCAAKVGGAKAIRENPSELIHYNLELTARNIKAAVDAGVERFAFISSSYVYPDLDHPAKEEDIWSGDVPAIHYGLGWIKRYLETLCIHHYMTSRTKFAIVRPTAIYGPHDDFNLETCHALPALIRKFTEGPYPVEVWGNGNEERQFTHVSDFAEGLLGVVENYCIADPINIATEATTTIRQLCEVLADLTGKLYRFTGGGPTVIERRIVDTAKAERLLNFRCETDLVTGLTQTLEWYKNERA